MPDVAGDRRLSTRVSLAATVVVLLATNIVGNLLGSAAHLAVGLVMVVTLLAVARARGLTIDDLGLRWSAPPVALRWATAIAVLATALYLVTYAVPALRPLQSSDLTRILVLIPLGTAIPEELAFRGVLLSLASARYGRRTGVLLSCALFALWHVLPALGGSAANQTVRATIGTSLAADAARVAGTLLVTFLAGLLFAGLRLRSSSLLAPVLAHSTINGVGVLISGIL